VTYCCQQDDRRDAVRQLKGWNGLDYVEVSDDQLSLNVYFLGKLPPELNHKGVGDIPYLKIEGGQRVKDIQVTGAIPDVDPDPAKDDFLTIQLDKCGDFSTYTLRLTGLRNIDPRYDHVDFSFKIGCPSDVDCAPACDCTPAILPEPEVNYLAKDYESFRKLILDRLAVLMPDWNETHAADLLTMLVEALAYTGDYLSYYQDAVATEAYLDTARQRISVRRHVRLVDYRLHEGCNARAWVCLQVSKDVPLYPAETAFITGYNDALATKQTILLWDDLRDVAESSYEVFEPLVSDRSTPIQLYEPHNEILFYTFGQKECCLEKGSTSATLLDKWKGTATPVGSQTNAAGKNDEHAATDKRTLQLAPGDVLIFEEVIGPKTGLAADADPKRRHAVRLTEVTHGQDPVIPGPDRRPTPYVRVKWARQDAMPFTFCISTLGPPPNCFYIENIGVAHGNVILVDHGRTLSPEDLGQVPTLETNAVCECAGEQGDIEIVPGKFAPHLNKTPLTYSEALPADRVKSGHWVSAASLIAQDEKEATPQVWLTSQPPEPWSVRYDLIESAPDDWQFVVEIDDAGTPHLRFGDGELGAQPPAGMSISATYRIGNGTSGNVGPESISRLVQQKTRLDGYSIVVRNPLPARGGVDPDPVDQAKAFAPHLFRKQIERAITAEDYQTIAERNSKVERASADLEWTGSWYEADVAIDPFGTEEPPKNLLVGIEMYLERFRRIGHDLAVLAARYVPLWLRMEVCALPYYERDHVKAALLEAFCNRVLPEGKLGFFHPDNLVFGEGIYLSRIIATAQAVPGVECVTVTKFQRLFSDPNYEIENGILPLATSEIAQLDNDPNFPERGRLEIVVGGGR
jgi:hypothetical protein